MTTIILASASPRRKELLQRLGLTFHVMPAQGEEVLTTGIPADAVKELSSQKAEEVAERILTFQESINDETGKDMQAADRMVVIGADTVVSIDHEIMGKPADHGEAVKMLTHLSGREHQVYTGLTVLVYERAFTEAEPAWKLSDRTCMSCCTDVYVYPMTADEIEAYVQTGEPMDKAGAYGIQGSFSRYVQKIDGDYNNVVGLPVSALWQIIKNYV